MVPILWDPWHPKGWCINNKSNKSNTNFKKELQTGPSEIFPANLWTCCIPPPQKGTPQKHGAKQIHQNSSAGSACWLQLGQRYLWQILPQCTRWAKWRHRGTAVGVTQSEIYGANNFLDTQNDASFLKPEVHVRNSHVRICLVLMMLFLGV